MESNENKVSKSKDDYIRNLEIDALVAFRNEGKMLSAKVVSIQQEQVKVETKNGSIYNIQKADIAWVKTGGRWPSGIYNALKGN